MTPRSALLSFAVGAVVALAVAITAGPDRPHRAGHDGGNGNATAGVYVARVPDDAVDASARHDLEVADDALTSARQAMLTALAEHFAARRRANAAPAAVPVAPASAPPPPADAVPDDTATRAAVRDDAPTRGDEPGGTRPELVARDAEPPESAPAPPARTRIDGEWLVTNAVESTRDRNAEGLRFDYRLRLRQQRDHIDGRGVRIARNGRPLPRAHQTPVSVTGTVDRGRVELRFAEHGRRSRREGRFTWDPTSDPDRLEGRFASEATGTIGRSAARRLAD